MRQVQLFYCTTRVIVISYCYSWHTVTYAFKTPLLNSIKLVNG